MNNFLRSLFRIHGINDAFSVPSKNPFFYLYEKIRVKSALDINAW